MAGILKVTGSDAILPSGSVSTGELAANAVTQAVMAGTPTALTTVSTAWVDMADMATTLTTTGGRDEVLHGCGTEDCCRQ